MLFVTTIFPRCRQFLLKSFPVSHNALGPPTPIGFHVLCPGLLRRAAASHAVLECHVCGQRLPQRHRCVFGCLGIAADADLSLVFVKLYGISYRSASFQLSCLLFDVYLSFLMCPVLLLPFFGSYTTGPLYEFLHIQPYDQMVTFSTKTTKCTR